MCQFAIVRAGAGNHQQQQQHRRAAGTACRCHCNGEGAATVAAGVSETAEELRRLPALLAARYFAAAPEAAAGAAQYSPALTAELRRFDFSAGAGSTSSASTVSSSPGPEAAETAAAAASVKMNDDVEAVLLKPAMRSEPQQAGRRVRFADELGRALTQVRLIEPVVAARPASPWQRSPPPEPPRDPAGAGGCCAGRSLWCRNFQQPSADRALSAIGAGAVRVQLSGLQLDPVEGVRVRGFALVANLHYRKRVFVRVTFDAWRGSVDVDAEFAGSLDERRDAFAFGFDCAAEVDALEFCLCFEAGGGERYWDNNWGGNYQVGLLPPPMPSRPVFCIGDADDEDD